MPRPRSDDSDEAWEAAMRRRRRKKRGGFSMPGVRWFFDLDPMSMFVLGMGMIGFISAMIGIAVPKAAYGAIAVGILLVVLGNLLFFLAACYAGVGCVLACMFIPFYSLYFLLTNLDETWRPFAMSIAGAVLLVVGIGIKGAHDFDDARPKAFDRQPEPWQAQPKGNYTPPSAKSDQPPPPPFEVDPALKTDDDLVFLCDLKMFNVKDGTWPVTPKGSGSATVPAAVNGKVSKHAIGMHPPIGDRIAEASYVLGGKAKRFKGWVALADAKNRDVFKRPVYFTVRGDGKDLWESAGITRDNTQLEFDIDVNRVKVLTLQTRTTNLASPYAIWYEPHLEK